MLLLTLILHFLLSLRAATAQQTPATTADPASTSFPAEAADTSRRLPISSSTAPSTTSVPPALQAADATVTTTAGAAIETWPIHSLFLPIHDPGNLAASIISVHPNHTAYALGCLPRDLRPSNATYCPLSPSMTLTEGVSTVMYTQIFDDDEMSTFMFSPATINCILYGAGSLPATLTRTPNANGPNPTPNNAVHAHASKAACTGHSAISGLGEAGATTTLASTQITYVDVTITAGVERLMESLRPVNGVSGGNGDEDGSENVGSRNLRVGSIGPWVVLVASGLVVWI